MSRRINHIRIAIMLAVIGIVLIIGGIMRLN
jgi:hypothetical protein